MKQASSLERHIKRSSSFPFAPWDLGDAIAGFFPYVKGSLAEWRYTIAGDESNPEFAPYALIYRMAFQDMGRFPILCIEPFEASLYGGSSLAIQKSGKPLDIWMMKRSSVNNLWCCTWQIIKPVTWGLPVAMKKQGHWQIGSS